MFPIGLRREIRGALGVDSLFLFQGQAKKYIFWALSDFFLEAFKLSFIGVPRTPAISQTNDNWTKLSPWSMCWERHATGIEYVQ